VSTIVVAPHQSWVDDLVLVGSWWFPSFGVKAEAKNWGLLSWILAGNRSFYVERGAD